MLSTCCSGITIIISGTYYVLYLGMSSHQIQRGLLQDVHHPLQLGLFSEDEVIIYPQHILGNHL